VHVAEKRWIQGLERYGVLVCGLARESLESKTSIITASFVIAEREDGSFRSSRGALARDYVPMAQAPAKRGELSTPDPGDLPIAAQER
jgi:hypothetical protein